MTQLHPRIILVDDDSAVREMLGEYLTSQGAELYVFESGDAAFAAIFEGSLKDKLDDVDLLITDLMMPGMNGIELVQRLKKINPDIPSLLVTAHGTIDSAIEATKAGVYNYIVKPFRLNELEVTIDRAIGYRRLKKQNVTLQSEVTKATGLGRIIGKSRAMQEVFGLIDRVSKATANVLIQGESGTGKEMVARYIHESGHRKDKPFIAINCTAIPASLMESELFGHVRGSFTGAFNDKVGLFEEANGGTIFLDEIGDLDLGLQAKLLRVIQERKIKPVGSVKHKDIDVRILSATHRDLKKAIQDGVFREDLYYRLSVIPVEIPPLRSRREDIPVLANHFLRKYSALNSRRVLGFTPAAMKRLMDNKWEGNVRELENQVERTVVLTNNEFIDDYELPSSKDISPEQFFAGATSDWPTLAVLEERYIRQVLHKTAGRKEKAAKVLGINRRTLYRKELDYSLTSGEDFVESLV
jgi:DNA-binding NtrC family response regulator